MCIVPGEYFFKEKRRCLRRREGVFIVKEEKCLCIRRRSEGVLIVEEEVEKVSL